MTQRDALTIVAIAVWTAPAAAQPPASTKAASMQSLSRIVTEPRAEARQRSFTYPIAEYEVSSGLWQPRSGIIAGTKIAPGTTLGVGVFKVAPTPRGYVGDVPPNMAPPKRTRRAAVGMSWQF